MHSMPILLNLDRGAIVIVGGGPAAHSKIALLKGRGASIRWYPGFGAAVPPCFNESSIFQIRKEEVRKSDLAEALAVITAADMETDRRIAQWARELAVPVNAVDRPELSSFHVPAIVERGDVVVAISTGGAAPVLARRLRAQIEALLPSRLADLAAFLGRLRLSLRKRSGVQDRHFWEEIIDGPIAKLVLQGRMQEAECLLAGRETVLKGKCGKVTLVGAGPGDPDLLTLKALHALQDADVIFHDALVAPEILSRARREAKKIPVGKRKGEPGIPQDEINQALITAASSGAHVVRLKGGDPLLFGRGGEELAALEAAAIPVSVIPGVTAALACAAEGQLPLTFRGEADRLVFLTGHLAGKGAADWSGLEDGSTTLAIYMGLSSAAAIRDGLIAAGRAPDTPAAIVARSTRSDSVTVTGPLRMLPSLAAQAGPGPALLIIGDVVRRCPAWRKTVAHRDLVAHNG